MKKDEAGVRDLGSNTAGSARIRTAQSVGGRG